MEVTSATYKLGIMMIMLMQLIIFWIVALNYERLKRIEERLGGPVTKKIEVPPQT